MSTPFVFELEMSYWISQNMLILLYPNRLPQKRTSYPMATYTVIDGDSILKLSGPSKLYLSRIQFDCYSTIYADSANLDASIEALLAPYTGAMGAANLLNATRHPRRNFDDTPPVSSDAGIYRTMSEWSFWYTKNPYGS